MADNIEVLDANGATVTVAADDISGTQHQRFKVQYGADGAATDASQATPFPVDDVSILTGEGAVTGRTSVEIVGRNADIDTTTDPEDVWSVGSTYTGHPTSTTPITAEVYSSDANDTSAGTGMRTCRVTYLATSTSTSYSTEDVTLSGATGVNMSNTSYRIIKVEGLTYGSGGTNAGTITVRDNVTTANVYAQVPIGYGQSAAFAYTVPQSSTLYIKRIRATVTLSGGGACSAVVTIRVRSLSSGGYNAVRTFDVMGRRGVDFQLAVPLAVAAQSDIKATVESVSTDDSRVQVEAEGVLVA